MQQISHIGICRNLESHRTSCKGSGVELLEALYMAVGFQGGDDDVQ